MLRHWRAASVAALLGALAFYSFFAAIYPSRAAIRLQSDGDLQALGRGFYPFEQNETSTYTWTSTHAELVIPALDRRVDWRLTANLNVWRPPGVPRPRVIVSVDGVPVLDRVIRGPFSLDVPVPRAAQSHATIVLETTPEFVPGPQDPRKLGIVLASVSIHPESASASPPARSAALGVLSVAVVGAAGAFVGLGWIWACLGAIAVAWCQAWLFTRGIAAHVIYPANVLWVAAALGGGALSLVWIAQHVRRDPFHPVTAAGIALSMSACYLKLLVLLHPSMPIGDGVFHAHRLEYVLGGRWYFTSVTPDNYTFPYPVFLYVIAAPFSFLASDTLDRVALLRVMTTVADAGAGLLLGWMVVRATSDRLAGMASIAWYQCIPMTAWIMTWGNLTNAFAQTLFVASLALAVAAPVEPRRRSIAILALVAASAMLTHPSTFAILAVVLTAAGAMFMWDGSDLHARGRAVLLSVAVAAAIACVLYYAWFPSVYVSELNRAASEAGSRVSAPTSLSTRAAKALELGRSYFGVAAVLAGAVGAWRLSRLNGSPALTRLVLAWAGSCVVFLIAGIVTPIDLRYHFAAFPVLAIAAAFGCAWAWRGGVFLRAVALLVVAVGAYEGTYRWMSALTPR